MAHNWRLGGSGHDWGPHSRGVLLVGFGGYGQFGAESLLERALHGVPDLALLAGEGVEVHHCRILRSLRVILPSHRGRKVSAPIFTDQLAELVGDSLLGGPGVWGASSCRLLAGLRKDALQGLSLACRGKEGPATLACFQIAALLVLSLG